MIDYNTIKEIVDKELNNHFSTIKNDCDPLLFDAITYAILNRGKRLRPVLMCLVADSIGIEIEKIMPLAISIEMIHSYSLIHDDLPSMDNDDFRSGNLTVHKKFGEATAILAGDALLNHAMETMINACFVYPELFGATKFIIDNSGYKGMIGGQMLDMSPDNLTEENISLMYIKKTGALINAAILSPLFVSQIKSDIFEKFQTFSISTGLAFQITDDLLDYDKELAEGKKTVATLWGIDATQKLLDAYKQNIIDSLDNLENTEMLKEYVLSILDRKS